MFTWASIGLLNVVNKLLLLCRWVQGHNLLRQLSLIHFCPTQRNRLQQYLCTTSTRIEWRMPITINQLPELLFQGSSLNVSLIEYTLLCSFCSCTYLFWYVMYMFWLCRWWTYCPSQNKKKKKFCSVISVLLFLFCYCVLHALFKICFLSNPTQT